MCRRSCLFCRRSCLFLWPKLPFLWPKLPFRAEVVFFCGRSCLPLKIVFEIVSKIILGFFENCSLFFETFGIRALWANSAPLQANSAPVSSLARFHPWPLAARHAAADLSRVACPSSHGHLPCVRAVLVSGPRPTCIAGFRACLVRHRQGVPRPIALVLPRSGVVPGRWYLLSSG